MSRSIRCFSVLAFSTLAACQKPAQLDSFPTGTEAPQKAQPAITESRPEAPQDPNFEASLQKAKKQALQEFPDLGIAGSQFNTEFLARTAALRNKNAEELKQPNWPYVLALQINTYLSNSTAWVSTPPAPSSIPTTSNPVSVQASAPNTPTNPAPAPSGPAPAAPKTLRYTVEELKALPTLPKTANVRGTITAVDIAIGAPLTIAVTLNDTLRCEVNLKLLNPGNNSMQLVRLGNDVALTKHERSEHDGKDYVSKQFYRIGQSIRVSGTFITSPNGKILLKGDLSN